MSTSAVNAGTGTGSGAGAGGGTGTGAGAGSGNTGTGNGTGNGTGTGTTTTTTTTSTEDDNKPITFSMLSALLGNFKKEVTTSFNRDLNGVKGSLEKHVEKLLTKSAAASNTDDTDADTNNTDTNTTTTTTTAANNTGTGNGTGNNGTPTPTAADLRAKKAERELKEMRTRMEVLEKANEAKDLAAKRASVDNAIITASGNITWATPKIKTLVESEARNKAVMNDAGIVTIEDMNPKDWFDAQYESDPGLRPAPINAGGSGNGGGRSTQRNWQEYNPNDPKTTDADRAGFRQYQQSLAAQIKRR